jgi:GTP-binding protein
MLFSNTHFLKSCSSPSQIPDLSLKKIAFWGRSNVGKSSLLNALIGKNKARVSKTPGRTQLINLFECLNPKSLWCDLPGYGYAKIHYEQTMQIGKMMSSFFSGQHSPDILCWLIDGRHNLTKTDFIVLPFIAQLDCEILIITTKNDKMSNQQRLKQRSLLLEQLKYVKICTTIIATSSSEKLGIEELENFLLKKLTLSE